jgi:hypothetical protein
MDVKGKIIRNTEGIEKVKKHIYGKVNSYRYGKRERQTEDNLVGEAGGA